MMKYMLDTNTCIYIIKRKPVEVIDRFRQLQISQVSISSVTLSELEYGVEKSAHTAQNRLALAEFAAPLEVALILLTCFRRQVKGDWVVGAAS